MLVVKTGLVSFSFYGVIYYYYYYYIYVMIFFFFRLLSYLILSLLIKYTISFGKKYCGIVLGTSMTSNTINVMADLTRGFFFFS